MNSAEQDNWQEITAAARAQIAKQVQLMPAMDPGEVAALMSAIDTAMWNEIAAAVHDDRIESLRLSLAREAQYGG